LVGPTGSLVNSVAEGATSLLSDRDAGEALETVAPLAMRKWIEMARNSGEFRDNSGGKLVDSNMGEKMAYAFGFVPQKVRKLKTYERLLADQERRDRSKDIKFFNDLADHYQNALGPEGNHLHVLNALSDKAENDPKVQFLRENGFVEEAEVEKQKKVREGGLKIAERVERRTIARDPMKSGTFNASSALRSVAHGMQQDQGVSREVDRLETRTNVMRMLGLPSQMNDKTFSRAYLIDQVRAKNPSLPYAQAAVIADQYLVRNPALQSALGLYR